MRNFYLHKSHFLLKQRYFKKILQEVKYVSSSLLQIILKGGESSSQFRGFTIAKIEL